MYKRIMEGILIVVTILILLGIIVMCLLQYTEAGLMLQICNGETVEDTNVTEEVYETIELRVEPDTIELSETVEPTTIELVEEETTYFSPDITFTSKYIYDGKLMPYVLHEPSIPDESGKKPLIVWLHGSGERDVSPKNFLKRGLQAVINSWELEGFNAYIISPHLTDNWNPGNWNTPKAKNNLQALIDQFVLENNVDTENIIIIGHSLGGQGALYMAHELPDYFSRCIVLSGYNPGTENSEIDIPTIGYVGTKDAEKSIAYMEDAFEEVFGKQNLFYVTADHAEVPTVTFNIDDDGNNRSDLVEWMFGELSNN